MINYVEFESNTNLIKYHLFSILNKKVKALNIYGKIYLLKIN